MTKYLIQDIETIAPGWPVKLEELKAAGKPADTFPYIIYHQVICIGMLALDIDYKPVKGGCAAGGLQGGKSEKEMIERWSEIASGKLFNVEPLRMVDWYGRGFDVPVLQTRAFRYGIRLPWYFGLQPDNRGQVSQWSKEYRDRYAGKHDDLAELWTNRGAFPRPHLADMAKLIGLPGKVSVNGANVEDMHKEGRFKEIDTYCMQDVIETAFLLQRYAYISGVLELDAYRSAAAALLAWTKDQPDQGEFVAGVNEKELFLEAV